jgi:hypothetical protein
VANDITSKFDKDFTGVEFYIERTSDSPLVAFKDGELYIQGRSAPKNSEAFYAPIITKIMDLIKKDKIHTINMDFDYFNVSSSYNFIKLLRAFEQINKNNAKITPEVKWYYKRDNEDMLEAGKDCKAAIQVRFIMIEKKF